MSNPALVSHPGTVMVVMIISMAIIAGMIHGPGEITGDVAHAKPIHQAKISLCGNGHCNNGESCSSCPKDCGACPPICGNSKCEVGESCSSCTKDCGACSPVCGNRVCEPGESCSSCSTDCGVCPPVCGNGRCEAGESCSSCSFDCGPCQNLSNLTSNAPSVAAGEMVVRYYYANTAS